jgi:hypothetical protein
MKFGIVIRLGRQANSSKRKRPQWAALDTKMFQESLFRRRGSSGAAGVLLAFFSALVVGCFLAGFGGCSFVSCGFVSGSGGSASGLCE